jgi:hypothetical protein
MVFCLLCIAVYYNMYFNVYMNVTLMCSLNLDVYCVAIQASSGKENLVSALTPCQNNVKKSLAIQ